MAQCRNKRRFHVRILTKLVILILFFLHHLELSAQSEDSIPLKNIDFSVQTSSLSNDLKVFYIQNKNSPLATIEWSLYPGTIAQKPEQEGMLALLDKFFLRPTQKDLSPIQFQNRIANLGLVHQSEINNESIHFQWIVPNQYLKDALILLHDCWFFPKWIDLEFQREKILLAKQIQQSELTPTWFLYREILSKILGQENISRQTIAADYYNIQKIDLQQLKDFKEKYFAPQNTILSISSQYNFQNVLHWADSLFAGWSNPKLTFSPDSIKFRLKHSATAFYITSEKTQIPILAVSFPFQDTLSLKSFLIAHLLTEIFNSKYSQFGKFFYEHDIGYQLVCNYRPSTLFSELLFSIALKREKNDYAIDLVRHFPVYAYHANWLNKRDLELAKSKLKMDYFLQNESPWQILHKMNQTYFMFNNLDYLHFLDTLQAIELNDLEQFFQKSINIPNPIAGFLMNSEDIKGSEIEKKLKDFWIQPFGPIYDFVDPEHTIIPVAQYFSKKDSSLNSDTTSILDTLAISYFKKISELSAKTINNYLQTLKIKKIVFNQILVKTTDKILSSLISISNSKPTITIKKDLIYFEFNSTNIDKPSLAILAKLAKELKSNPNLKLRLTGHTDSSGPADFNLKLSLQRAEKVKNYLVNQYKISPERIITKGLGETQLAFPENTLVNRAKNRRVEAEILLGSF
jgi:outer membrane protein OmpA-like peptidoglycan-associated protein/predicted Zn-dependent peptidase